MNKSLKKNAILNIIKQVCTILFPLITFPYISRILGAENYGKYNFSSSIVSYFSLIASLGVAAYAIREGAKLRDDKKVLSLLCSEIFTINLFSTITAYIVLGLCLLIIPKLHQYSILIIILSLNMLLTTLGTDWINSIYEEYDYITIRYIAFQLISIILMFLLVHSKEDYYFYAIITVLANAGANICNFIHVRKFVKCSLIKVKNIKRHLLPMIILLCNSIAITVYVNSDITMLGFFSNDTQVGIYSAVVKIYTLLKQLIVAVVVVLVPRLSYYLGRGDIILYQKHINTLINGLFAVIAPIILGTIMLSKNIILFLGGNQYVSGAFSLVVLSCAILFSIMAYVFANLVLVLNAQENKFLIATTIGAITNVVLNLFFIPLWGINGAAFTTLISEIVVCLLCLKQSIKYCQIEVDKNNIISVLLGCIIGFLECSFMIGLGMNNILTILLSVFATVISYFLILLLFKNQLIIDLFYKKK